MKWEDIQSQLVSTPCQVAGCGRRTDAPWLVEVEGRLALVCPECYSAGVQDCVMTPNPITPEPFEITEIEHAG